MINSASNFDGLLVTGSAAGLFLIENAQPKLIYSATGVSGMDIKGSDIVLGLPFVNTLSFCSDESKKRYRHIYIDDIHDILQVNGDYYVVGTYDNAVYKFNKSFELQQCWKMSDAKDSWHLNCLAYWNGRVVFSAFGDFSNPFGYRGHTAGQGFVQDLLSGERIITGLNQPHSVIAHGENLFLANSRECELREYNAQAQLVRCKKFSHYTRGIYIDNDTLYLGLSADRNAVRAGHSGEFSQVLALDLQTLEEKAALTLPTTEIYTMAMMQDIPHNLPILESQLELLKKSIGNHVETIKWFRFPSNHMKIIIFFNKHFPRLRFLLIAIRSIFLKFYINRIG
jgi:Domain of unknown function (DUF4915)